MTDSEMMNVRINALEIARQILENSFSAYNNTEKTQKLLEKANEVSVFIMYGTVPAKT